VFESIKNLYDNQIDWIVDNRASREMHLPFHAPTED
jgi:hypothetical protein